MIFFMIVPCVVQAAQVANDVAEDTMYAQQTTALTQQEPSALFSDFPMVVQTADNIRRLPLPAAGLLFAPAMALVLGLARRKQHQDPDV
ncbi:MAG: hypothetical protein RL563_490 [Pseudomonadota bacterium]